MQIVTADARRVTTTPNAVMTTLASPTQGGAAGSVWMVEMPAGIEGPVHAFTDEVIWAITRGRAKVICEGVTETLEAGATVVLPGGAMRQFVTEDGGFSAVAATAGTGEVRLPDGSNVGVPAWVA